MYFWGVLGALLYERGKSSTPRRLAATFDDRPWRRKRTYISRRGFPFLGPKNSKPISELPQVVKNLRPSRTMLSVRRPKTPIHIIGRRNGDERRPAVPIPGYQPEIKPKEPRGDRQMPH